MNSKITITKYKMRNRLFHIVCSDIHVREAAGGGDSRIITGYAVLFDTPSLPLWDDEYSEAREVIAKGAITKELLDNSDIKFTMFHDRQLILARSNKGSGTLSYEVDDKGVKFEFESPKTVDGDKALELVRRGDIAGCSFAFSTYYNDQAYVNKEVLLKEEKEFITYTVKVITDIYDFTLAADPAYPDTNVDVAAREDFIKNLKSPNTPNTSNDEVSKQVKEMRDMANKKL
jgi:hypothetical protein